MDAPQGVDFLRRVQPRSAIPVHYDDYKIFKSPLSAFVKAAREPTLNACFARYNEGTPLTCCERSDKGVG